MAVPSAAIRKPLPPAAAGKSKSLANRLVEENLGLVQRAVNKLLARLPAGVDTDNLLSAGTLGLVEAARKFDPARGIRFSTYAFARIRGAVLDELRRNCPVPQHKLEQARRVRKACEGLVPSATAEQVAQRTGLTIEQVTDSMAALQLTHILSLDRQRTRGEVPLLDRYDRPDVRAEKEEQKQRLTRSIERLPDRQRLVVTLYYMEELRLRQIGALLKLSESRVSRLLSAALAAIAEDLSRSESAA